MGFVHGAAVLRRASAPAWRCRRRLEVRCCASVPGRAATPEEENKARLQVDDGALSESGVLLPPRLAKNEMAKEKSKRSGAAGALALGVLFAAWYISNTIFNVYNKQVLKVYPFPLTCTAAQFLIGSLMMIVLWVFRVQRVPILDRASIPILTVLSLCHAAGFYLTNASLGAVSVALTHTVKATEPFFSVALSPTVLGVFPTWGVLATLVPIVVGVGLASATEATFTWFGFTSAMGSNLALQLRNVLSKNFMKRGESSIDNVNLFALISIGAFIFMCPVVAFEAPTSMPALSQAALPAVVILQKTAIGGVMRCIDVLSSYMILKRVSPVSHSVGNCVKRAIVITSSVIFFKSKVSALNAFGTTLALLGVLVYSLVVVGCKQNKFGPDSPLCRPVYEEMDLVEGAGI